MRSANLQTLDALSGWATPPRAARLAGDEVYRWFETAGSAVGFLHRATAAAERQRRRRERLRRGEIVVPTPVCGQVLDTLIALRWLDEHVAEDRGKIGEAIGAMLTDLAKHRE